MELNQEIIENSILLPQSLSNASLKRRNEFLAGRYCAKKACEYIGYSLDDLPIDKSRSPKWPEGIVGSITHTSDIAACLVGKSDLHFGIGIDIEPLISRQIFDDLKSIVLTKKEDGLHTILERDQFHTLIYSAKESIYKSIYPIVGRIVDFHEVNCTKVFSTSAIFEFNAALSKELCGYSNIRVHYLIEKELVFTWCRL
jgi:enterobactin synthetase component D